MVKVILRTARHDPVQCVDNVWRAVFCLEKLVDLVLYREVRLERQGRCTLWRLRLNDIGENKVAIRRLGVGE